MIDETERMTKREYRILLVTIIGLLIFGLIAMLLVMTA
jgi:capsule polysaccharide export protein KpsE/RkpR